MEHQIIEMTPSEQMVMEYIWEHGNVTFREVLEYCNQEKGKGWKKQTLNTYLSHLLQKGLIKSDGEKRKIYSPVESREKYGQKKARSIVDTLFGGRVRGFLSAFCGDERITPEEIGELEEVLQQMKKDMTEEKGDR